MRPALALVLTLAAWSLAACGDPQGVDPSADPEVTASAAVALVSEDEADLVLHASNQSFDDEEVRLRITVDGATVVDADFHVEGQHNWFTFPLALPPGAHEISAEADSGATLTKSFRTKPGEKRYVVIDHWGEGGTAELTWQLEREPIAFA